MDIKCLKLRVPIDLYDRFKQLHKAYGEESRVFRELLENYVKQQERLAQIDQRIKDAQISK